MNVTVVNLATEEEQEYSCSPRQAVVSAYALSRKDRNTWDYRKRYDHLVVVTEVCVSIGNWYALHKGETKW